MNKNNTPKWNDIYRDWKIETRKFPELCGQLRYLSVNISKPQYGQCYFFDWVPKIDEENAIQAGVTALASGWPEVGTSWSKGTIKTASLLASCETEEECAAVWLCSFALSLLRHETDRCETYRNALHLEHEACAVFARKYGYWHSSSRDLLPESYIPANLLWESKDLSVSTLVELAAINAALVMTHYTPVEYKRVWNTENC